MRFGVLGPLTVWTADGEPVPVPGAKVRMLLARLLIAPGRPVSTDRLVDDVWGANPPDHPHHPRNTLQGQVSRLRAVLERAQPGGRELLVNGPAGYQLRAEPDAVDAARFTALLQRSRSAGPRERAALLSDALGLWRGDAFAGFAEEPFARPAAGRLEEDRLTALEDRLALRAELGEHGEIIGELDELVAAHPLRERLRAVQLRVLYRAGRQTDALTGYEDLRRRLDEDLGLEPGGELAALHQAILRQDPALDLVPDPGPAPGREADRAPDPASGRPPAAGAGPARGADPQPGSGGTPRPAPAGEAGLFGGARLPAPVAGMIGRDDAVPAAVRTLAESRLVTLTGPGGVGKTRLALETARGAAGGFPDGVWLGELAALPPSAPAADPVSGPALSAGAARDSGSDTGADAVAEVLMKVLDIRDIGGPGQPGGGSGGPGGPVPPLARLAGALRGRELLLVLDNCEHIVEPVAGLVAALLREVPGLSVLATSQEPLGVDGERVLPVPPLGPAAAVDLFLARAVTPPGFLLDPENARAVAALCARLDGIPLALELAAARVRTLGVHGLLARLDDRFALLAGGLRSLPERQRTLRAVIDWSWGLLTPAERTVLRRLSVFAGSCTLEAVEAVCAGGGVRAGETLDLTARLVDRSLVVLVDRADGPAYRLLESVKEYGRERLHEAGETEAVRERHSRHYTGLALRAAPMLRGPEQQHWLERLDRAGADLDRAVGFAVRTGAADRALRTVNALTWYWVLRGRPSDARRALDTALAAVPGIRSDQRPGAAPAVERARAMAWRLGVALLDGAAPADSAERIRSVAAYEGTDGVDDPLGHATALWFLGSAQMGSGAVDTGERLVNRALEGFRALGDDWGTAAALSVRARHAMARGDLDAVRRDGESSARLFRAIGDRWGQLQTVFPLAALSEISGDYARATRLQQDGLAIAEQLGLWTEAAKRLSGLGRLALLAGDHARAADCHRRAWRLAREQHFRDGEADARLGLGLGARREGDFELAENHLREVLAWFREVDYGPGVALALAELGFAAEQRGDAVAAHALHREGFAVAGGLGDARAVALALEGLAGARAAAGDHERSALLLGTAAAARESVGAPLPRAERRDVDRISAAARAALGPVAYTAAFDRGTAFAVEDVPTLPDPDPVPAPRLV
ncbi:AfsR/SARP family transcriptional regulator [Streptomyces jumonjinensis]|uniref:AfsR/SARP family transcriptional regulator n=1 Tax=Streptomyces jumonjinensis TaxID=1945 RepID=UPI0037A8C0A0